MYKNELFGLPVSLRIKILKIKTVFFLLETDFLTTQNVKTGQEVKQWLRIRKTVSRVYV